MEKYKRFSQEINAGDVLTYDPKDEEIQKFLDEITTDGWKIIYYNEKVKDVGYDLKVLVITVIGSKTQSDIL
jgi:hypothetical protein